MFNYRNLSMYAVTPNLKSKEVQTYTSQVSKQRQSGAVVPSINQQLLYQ